MSETRGEYRLPSILAGSVRSVESAIEALASAPEVGSLLRRLDDDCRVVSLPLRVSLDGTAMHPEMLGEVVGTMVLLSGDIARVGDAAAGVSWAELGLLLWVSGWRASRRDLVAGLHRCAKHVDTCANLESGMLSVTLRDTVRAGSEDLLVAWKPSGATLSEQLASTAEHISNAKETQVIAAIERCAARYSSELRDLGPRPLTAARIRRAVGTLNSEEYEFVATARLSVVIDLVLRGA